MSESDRLQRYFQCRIKSTINLNHKGNNRLFRVLLEDGGEYLAKEYSEGRSDGWRRGEAESRAISFLQEKNFEGVPRFYSFDPLENIGIYSYEKGKILSPSEVSSVHIKHAVDFLIKLHSLPPEEIKSFPPACSAGLCLQDYLNDLHRRLRTVSEYTPNALLGSEPLDFLSKEVRPKINELEASLMSEVSLEYMKKPLQLAEQVLDFGDFGFHNILVDEDRFVFVDYEYFGRDDPVRQQLNFLHHENSSGIKREFLDQFIRDYIKGRKLGEEFKKRLKLCDPLIGMEWVLIYLNVLSSSYLKHIQVSHDNDGIEERVRTSFEKAKIKIGNLNFFKTP